MKKKNKRKQSFIDAHALLVIAMISILVVAALVMIGLKNATCSKETVIEGKLEGYIMNLEKGTTTLIFDTGNATYEFLEDFDSQINGTWQLINEFNIFGNLVGQALVHVE